MEIIKQKKRVWQTIRNGVVLDVEEVVSTVKIPESFYCGEPISWVDDEIVSVCRSINVPGTIRVFRWRLEALLEEIFKKYENKPFSESG